MTSKMTPEVATTRAGRQARIVALLSSRPVHSQAELAAMLAAEGIEVTQATLSRDLEELGAVKLRGADGGVGVYVVPEDGSPVRGRLRRHRADVASARRTVGVDRRQRQPGGAAHPARRRALSGQRHRPRGAAVCGRHHRRRRHHPGGGPRADDRRRTGRNLREPASKHPNNKEIDLMSERVILAYSGGLDTSVAISWIGKETGREVVAVAIDLGQGGEDMEVVRQRARGLRRGRGRRGRRPRRVRRASTACPPIQSNALYMDRYPLVSAISRPLIVKHLVAAAREHGGGIVAHGCTGKGNDQVRFEVGFASLAPDLEVLAPVRDYAWTREKAIAFAEENAIPINVTQALAVLDRPERVGPRGGNRLPRAPVERAHQGRLRLHRGPDGQLEHARRGHRRIRAGRAGVDRRQAGHACCRRSRNSTGAPARRASAGSTSSRTGWSASRAARSTRRRARWC